MLTIEQLVDQDEIVLDCLFVEFAKIGTGDGNEAVQEFEYERRIGVASEGNEADIDIADSDVKEGGRA
ncbi:hypothetical protein QFC19_001974 [Naganishia cerealis]|uniref:Uncharacterized protein n=1 Tax=Naganishia cerealis TaxID=610337 RepID=A0ACC2WEW2_9TREE|nr:hypothetical protein QFC19_001974 [Naganishia cerealis]